MSNRHNHKLRILVCVFLAFPEAIAATSFSVDHVGKIDQDLANQPVPTWSSGELITVVSNQTANPTVLRFGSDGKGLQPFIMTIPGSQVVDVIGWGLGPDGTLVTCGQAYDNSGRGAGFIATVTTPSMQNLNITRLGIYVPYRCTAPGDGTVWSVGIELQDGLENGPLVDKTRGTVRRFGLDGSLKASYVPRASLRSSRFLTWGFLASESGRTGWYSGPMRSSSQDNAKYVEISDSGSQTEYPGVQLGTGEILTGLALTAGGSTFVTVTDQATKTWRMLQLDHAKSTWVAGSLPPSIASSPWASIYGGSGNYVALRKDRFTFEVLRLTDQ